MYANRTLQSMLHMAVALSWSNCYVIDRTVESSFAQQPYMDARAEFNRQEKTCKGVQ